MASNNTQATRETTSANDNAALAATGIDLDTIRKVKELCDRYGAATLKQVLADLARAREAA